MKHALDDLVAAGKLASWWASTTTYGPERPEGAFEDPREPLLEALALGPGTEAEIAERVGDRLTRGTVSRYLHTLRDEGAASRWWARGQTHAWGLAGDRPPGAHDTARDAVLALALREPVTPDEAEAELGMSQAWRYLRELEREGVLTRKAGRYGPPSRQRPRSDVVRGPQADSEATAQLRVYDRQVAALRKTQERLAELGVDVAATGREVLR